MKIYLAAVSALYKENADLLEDKKVNILESFISMNPDTVKLINGRDFLLDSGAFSFMNSKKTGNINWEEYVDKYINFINKNNIEHFFELDIDSIVGYRKVLQLRGILEEGTGKKCIPVWHKNRGIDEFKKMCNDYDYVSIGGIITKEIKQNEYPSLIPLIKYAHKNNCKIHGLGFTSTRLLTEYHFDSVDSTNWLYGRYGHYYIKEGGYMHLYRRPRNKRCIQQKLQRHNLLEWIKFQKYAEVNL